MSERPVSCNEAGREQSPSALWSSYYEVCMPQNEKTLHADLLLAGITQLIAVLVADKLQKHQYIRSLKPLVA